MRLFLILFLFVSVSGIGQSKKIIVLNKLDHKPMVNVTLYSIDGDLLAVSNIYGEVYFYNDIQIPDSVFVSKDDICDTLITNFSKIDTLFVQFPCYNLDAVDITGSRIGLKKYWNKVHNDTINKEIGVGDTVLFYRMDHIIAFPDYNKNFEIKGIIGVSINRLKGQVNVEKIEYYFESIEGDSTLINEYFFKIFPRFPLEDYISNYTNLLLVNNISKGTREKDINMRVSTESKKVFSVSDGNNKDKRYLYGRENEFMTYLHYTSDSSDLGHGLIDYSSVIIKYSVSKPRFIKELSTVLCTNIPKKKIYGSLSEKIFIVKMHLSIVDNPMLNKDSIDWGNDYSTYIELITEIRRQQRN